MNKKELRVLFWSTILLVLMILVGYKIRGDFAAGGEILLPISIFGFYLIVTRADKPKKDNPYNKRYKRKRVA